MTQAKNQGQGTARQLPSGRWQVRYSHEGKQKSGGTFATEKQAKAKLAEIQTDIRRGLYFDEEKGAVLFRDHVEKVMSIRRAEVRPGTYRNNVGELRNHLLPTFGHLPLNKISKEKVATWFASMAHSPSSRFQSYNCLRVVMNYAVEWDMIRSSPCTVKAPRKGVEKDRPVFSVQAFKAVVEQTPEEFHVVAWTFFGAHPRMGEMLALTRGDFDAEAGTLKIDKQLQGGQITLTKTGTSRTVKVLEPALTRLRAYVKSRAMFPTAPLFTTRLGRPLNEAYIRGVWNPAREAAGFSDMRVHDIRHTSLSACGHSGMTLKEVMFRAGHSTVDMALRYMGSDESRQLEAAERTSQALLTMGL